MLNLSLSWSCQSESPYRVYKENEDHGKIHPIIETHPLQHQRIYDDRHNSTITKTDKKHRREWVVGDVEKHGSILQRQ